LAAGHFSDKEINEKFNAHLIDKFIIRNPSGQIAKPVLYVLYYEKIYSKMNIRSDLKKACKYRMM